MTARLGGSVGRRAVNAPDDVKTVQILLERHGGWLIPLRRVEATGVCDDLTIAAIERFQLRAMGLLKPDGVIWPYGSTITALSRLVNESPQLGPDPNLGAGGKTPVILKPVRGAFTFDCEGMEAPGNQNHSRVLHVPDDKSGVTIGRGYDMKDRIRADIVADLVSAGVPAADAKEIAKASRLAGADARAFRDAHKGFSITPEIQLKLFEISYSEKEASLREISDRADCVQAYGKVVWDKLHPAVYTIFVDLRFRGDWYPGTRKFCQRYLVNNDLQGLAECMKSHVYWQAVVIQAPDRFKRRNDFLAKALAHG
jgi:hypothetical protein